MKFNLVNIETRRLRLRPIAAADMGALLAIYKDPECMRYWSDPPMQDISQAREKISRNSQANEEGTALTLAIEQIIDKKMIGHISLFNIHQPSGRAEVGYILSKEHWHKGIMSEAIRAFITYCFTDLKLRRLEADIDPENQGSAALLKRMGFVLEGLLKERWQVGDLITDSEVYGLLKSNWLKQP